MAEGPSFLRGSHAWDQGSIMPESSTSPCDGIFHETSNQEQVAGVKLQTRRWIKGEEMPGLARSSPQSPQLVKPKSSRDSSLFARRPRRIGEVERKRRMGGRKEKGKLWSRLSILNFGFGSLGRKRWRTLALLTVARSSFDLCLGSLLSRQRVDVI